MKILHDQVPNGTLDMHCLWYPSAESHALRYLSPLPRRRIQEGVALGNGLMDNLSLLRTPHPDISGVVVRLDSDAAHQIFNIILDRLLVRIEGSVEFKRPDQPGDAQIQRPLGNVDALAQAAPGPENEIVALLAVADSRLIQRSVVFSEALGVEAARLGRTIGVHVNCPDAHC